MKRLAQDIVKGKKLEENLPEFARQMMGIYSDYAFVRLAMNYYTYYGMVADGNGSNRDEGLSKIRGAVNDIIKKAAEETLSSDELENILSEAGEIRQNIINIMTGLTSYADIFNIYEYCLNRAEYRFKDGSSFLKRSDEELTEEVFKYILSDTDNVVMNIKIEETVRQLPMRMTKAKFFELLRAGIGVYKESEISGVEDFLYMLKTTAMIETSPYTELLSEDIKLIRNEFENTSFKDMTEERYNDLKSKCDYVTTYLMDIMDMYMVLGELINDVYVILLSEKYYTFNSETRQICSVIIKGVSNMFDKSGSDEGVSDDEYDSAAEKFIQLEGKQETLSTKLSSYEYVTDHVTDECKEQLKSLSLEEQYNALKQMALYESDSIFAEYKEKNQSPADENYINTVTDTFISQLKEFFANHEKLVNRAVMAHILSGLPVFFNNTDELREYVYNSFNQCSDLAEKAAVAEIMEQLMSEE